jgi:hypothetical protein
VRAEQAGDAAGPQGVHDEHVCGGGAGLHRDALRRELKFFQCACQARGLPESRAPLSSA